MLQQTIDFSNTYKEYGHSVQRVVSFKLLLEMKSHQVIFNTGTLWVWITRFSSARSSSVEKVQFQNLCAGWLLLL